MAMQAHKSPCSFGPRSRAVFQVGSWSWQWHSYATGFVCVKDAIIRAVGGRHPGFREMIRPAMRGRVGSLQGSPRRPLYDALKVNLKLPWRPRDVGEAWTIGYSPRRVEDTYIVELAQERGCLCRWQAWWGSATQDLWTPDDSIMSLSCWTGSCGA